MPPFLPPHPVTITAREVQAPEVSWTCPSNCPDGEICDLLWPGTFKMINADLSALPSGEYFVTSSREGWTFSRDNEAVLTVPDRLGRLMGDTASAPVGQAAVVESGAGWGTPEGQPDGEPS